MWKSENLNEQIPLHVVQSFMRNSQLNKTSEIYLRKKLTFKIFCELFIDLISGIPIFTHYVGTDFSFEWLV